MKKEVNKRKVWHKFFIILCIISLIVFGAIMLISNTYIDWEARESQFAMIGVGIHSFTWFFVRIVPIVFICSLIGAILTRNKK